MALALAVTRACSNTLGHAHVHAQDVTADNTLFTHAGMHLLAPLLLTPARAPRRAWPHGSSRCSLPRQYLRESTHAHARSGSSTKPVNAMQQHRQALHQAARFHSVPGVEQTSLFLHSPPAIVEQQLFARRDVAARKQRHAAVAAAVEAGHVGARR